MSTLDREAIYSRVFAFFEALAAEDGSKLFKSATRKPGTWEKYSPEEAPALLIRENREVARKDKFKPTAWTFHVDLLVFIHTGAATDDSIVPPQAINPLLDAVTSVFDIDDFQTGECTLGGLVTSAAIDGTVHKYLGTLGDEAVVAVPIRVLVTK